MCAEEQEKRGGVLRVCYTFSFQPHESLTTKLEHGYGIKVVYTAGITHDEIENIALELDELKVNASFFLHTFRSELLLSLQFLQHFCKYEAK